MRTVFAAYRRRGTSQGPGPAGPRTAPFRDLSQCSHIMLAGSPSLTNTGPGEPVPVTQCRHGRSNWQAAGLRLAADSGGLTQRLSIPPELQNLVTIATDSGFRVNHGHGLRIMIRKVTHLLTSPAWSPSQLVPHGRCRCRPPADGRTDSEQAASVRSPGQVSSTSLSSCENVTGQPGPARHAHACSMRFTTHFKQKLSVLKRIVEPYTVMSRAGSKNPPSLPRPGVQA